MKGFVMTGMNSRFVPLLRGLVKAEGQGGNYMQNKYKLTSKYVLRYILIINQRDALISQIYFWNRTLHVSDRFSVHHQECSTVYTAIGICHTGYADCLLASKQHNLYDTSIPVAVYTSDDGQKTCPKHVEFYSKNKFEKLVRLVGFIIRIYHDARSSESPIYKLGCT